MRRGEPITASRSGSERYALGGLALALTVGFAVFGCARDSNAGGLGDRAQKYMELRQKGSWEEIYEGMVDPDSKPKLSRDAFMERRKSAFDILEFEVVSVEETEGQGVVRARMQAVLPVLKPGGGTLSVRRELDDAQKWVQRDGRWYIQLRG